MAKAKTIAKELNLSVSTVGRALNNDPRISEATRQRVHEAANRVGYVASRAAQMMRGASSKLVGFVLADLGNSQFSFGAHALAKCLEAGGYHLVLSETGDDADTELRHVRELYSAGAAGIVIVPSDKPRAETVRLLGLVPHVQFIRRHLSLGNQWFCFDNIEAMRTATKHLVELGHERIGYIGLPPASFAGRERFEGYRAGLEGLELDDELSCFGPGASSEFGQIALRRLMGLSKPPTGLVLGSLQITRGILDEAVEKGIRIPEDLSVVGFGDEAGFRWWKPGLTTISVPIGEIATSCGLWLLNQLRQGGWTSEHAFGSTTLGSLVVRGSTAKPG